MYAVIVSYFHEYDMTCAVVVRQIGGQWSEARWARENTERGDEPHFLMRYKAFTKGRNMYLGGRHLTGSDTVRNIMKSVSKYKLKQLAKFAKIVMETHNPIITETKEGKFLKRNKVSRYGRKIKPNINETLFLY